MYLFTVSYQWKLPDFIFLTWYQSQVEWIRKNHLSLGTNCPRWVLLLAAFLLSFFFPISSVPFHLLSFFQGTIFVFQQLFWKVFLSGEPYFVVQKLSLLAPPDSSLHRRSSPPFFGAIWAATCHHLLRPSFLIFSRFVKSTLLQSNLGAPTTTMVLVFLQFRFYCSFFLYPSVESPPLVMKLPTLGFKKVETCFEPSEAEVFSSSLFFKQYSKTSSTSLSCPSNVFLWNSISVMFFIY